MPWFDPLPSTTELEYWGVRLPSTPELPALHPVAFWPHPNSTRVASGYRLLWSKSAAAAPGRVWFAYRFSNPFPPGSLPTVEFAGWDESELVSDGKVSFSLPTNAFGYSMSATMESFDSLPTLPQPGCLFTHRIERDDGEWIEDQWSYRVPESQYQPKDFRYYGSNIASNSRLTSAGWGYRQNGMFYQMVGDCYHFPAPP